MYSEIKKAFSGSQRDRGRREEQQSRAGSSRNETSRERLDRLRREGTRNLRTVTDNSQGASDSRVSGSEKKIHTFTFLPDNKNIIYLTSKGRPVCADESATSETHSLEEDNKLLEEWGYAGKFKRLSPFTGFMNYGYVFQIKGSITDGSARTAIEDDFERVRTPQIRDLIVYRSSSTHALTGFSAVVSEVSNDGTASKVIGTLGQGMSIFEYHPDAIPDLNPGCYYEFFRRKRGATLTPISEFYAPGGTYTTSKGNSVEFFRTVGAPPAYPLDREIRDDGLSANEVERIEGPTLAYNCHGHALLGKKGVLTMQGAMNILQDDFTLVETPQGGDLLVGLDMFGVHHTAVIGNVTSNGEISQVISKEGVKSLYTYSFDTMKNRMRDKDLDEDYDWKFFRKDSSGKKVQFEGIGS